MIVRFPVSYLVVASVVKAASVAALGLTIVAGAVQIASDAQAQGFRFGAGVYYNGPDALISPRSIVGRLQDDGFTEITRPRFDGTAYIIDATSPSGARTRLFVDAREGDIIGRRRLEAPYYPSMRAARPRPGYGWTEDDLPGRTARAPEGLVPPADVPGASPRALRFDPESIPPRAGIDENPLGVNPDGRSRPAQNGRRTAKLTGPQKPAAPSASPSAPVPHVGNAQSGKPDAETAKVEPPKAEPVTPAANQPSATAAEKPKTDAPKKDQAWKDPPADESKRKVRVIDGATVVPGSGEAGSSGAN